MHQLKSFAFAIPIDPAKVDTVRSRANRKNAPFACSNDEKKVLQILSARTFRYLSNTPVYIFKMIYFAKWKVL
jgi:hypothetical protein